MSENGGPYVIAHGDVWWRSTAGGRNLFGLSDDRHVCDGTGNLAVAYDAEDGTLHKHGSEAAVLGWADRTRKAFLDSGFEDAAGSLVVVCFPASEETVTELNACVATSGRVLRVAERLGAIAEARPELLERPRYPSR